MFSKNTLFFLDELSANNNRVWFDANKARYELFVREPALDFIEAMEPVLKKFAPHFRADTRKVGGSLMRIYRDTRFSQDKTPYKTNIGIQFRHELSKGVHAPGFYVHLSANECFFGVGCWKPESETLGKIRDRIVDHPEKWFSARNSESFNINWELGGDSLTRPPRGYDGNHPAIEDIKRKDFVAISYLSVDETLGAGLLDLAGNRFSETVLFMNFLCAANSIEV
jgi:uncharacterized protein (TIGR02453 family)